MDKMTNEKLGAVVTKIVVSYASPKSWNEHETAESGSFGIEADVPVGSDFDASGDAMFAYCKAMVGRNLELKLKPLMQEPAESAGTEAFGPPANLEGPAESAPEAQAEEGHSQIAKYKLSHEGGDKYVLKLYPLVHFKSGKVGPGEFVEIQHTAGRVEMWEMLKEAIGDVEIKLPVEREVEWLAEGQGGLSVQGPGSDPRGRVGRDLSGRRAPHSAGGRQRAYVRHLASLLGPARLRPGDVGGRGRGVRPRTSALGWA